MLPLVKAVREQGETLERHKIEFRRNRTWGEYISIMAALPGIRGAWGMGSTEFTGAVYDQTGQGRTLTYNGNPVFNQYKQIIPYLDLDGTGDFLSRPDESGLDILGNETIYASAVRGLTLGGWFWLDSVSGTRTLMGKFSSVGGNHSYRLVKDATPNFLFQITNDGTNAVTATSTITPATGTWYFVVGRFTPSTEVAIFVNGTKDVNTSSIPASIFSGNATFRMGGDDAGNLIDGRTSLGFLSANWLSDDVIQYLYHYGNVLMEAV